jgi:hypothetical protein
MFYRLQVLDYTTSTKTIVDKVFNLSTKFLDHPKSKIIRNRARFYLNHVLYFIKQTKKLFNFWTQRSGVNFINKFCHRRFTPILLTHRVDLQHKSWAYFLAVNTSKGRRIFVGETEFCKKWLPEQLRFTFATLNLDLANV